MDIDLKVNEVYRVTHRRKGVFVGLLMDVVPTDPADEVDDVFLYMKIDTRVGSGQEHLMGQAGLKGLEPVKLTNIRPSLVTHIEMLEGENWLRTIKVPGEPDEGTIEDKGMLGRLRGLFGKIGD